jgi:hypothetical protein
MIVLMKPGMSEEKALVGYGFLRRHVYLLLIVKGLMAHLCAKKVVGYRHIEQP